MLSFFFFIVPNMACLLLLVMEATCLWWGSLRGLHGFIVSDFMLNFYLFRFLLFGFPFISPSPNHLHWPSFPYFTCDEKMEPNLGKILRNVEIVTWVLLTKQLPKNSRANLQSTQIWFQDKWWDFCVNLSPSLVCAGLAFLWFPSCNQIYVYIYTYLSLYLATVRPD